MVKRGGLIWMSNDSNGMVVGWMGAELGMC